MHPWTPICAPSPPSPAKNYSWLWPRFHFSGLALTHILTWKQKLVHRVDQEKSDQLQSSSYSSGGENQSINEKENREPAGPGPKM